MKISATLSTLLLLFTSTANALVVFSDDFQAGDTAGWTHSTNYGGAAGIENSLWGAGAAGVDVLDGVDRSLRTYLNAPPGGSALWSRATVDFTVGADGDYYLGLEARSRNCDGCTMFYEIFLNGVALWDHLSPGATAVTAFEDRDFLLSGLSAGSHQLSLGVYTTVAQNGIFHALFDDVCISDTRGEDCFATASVPEPSVLGLLAIALISLVRRRTAV